MFALGAGPVPGLLLPEIFPSRIRAKAMAICMCVHWVIIYCLRCLHLEAVKGDWFHILETELAMS